MEKVSFLETIDPATLDPKTLTAFSQRLYAIQCQIFDGVDARQFEKKVFAPDAKWTKIRIFNNAGGNAVGYCALHAYEKAINSAITNSETMIIFRAETGMLRKYRKQGNIFSFFFKEAIKYKICHPFKKSYLFCTLIHPSSYHLISKFFFRSYPNINYTTPVSILDKMNLVADAFQESQLPNIAPSLRDVGWITRQTAEEQSELANSSDPATCFFLKKNPDYHKGQGLMTLVPLDLKNIFLTSLIVLSYLGSNKVRGFAEKLTTKWS
jgi:hypothetical protein